MSILTISTMSTSNRRDRQRQTQNSKATREFFPGDSVFARSFVLGRPRWTPAIVLSCSGPVSYQMRLQNGTQWNDMLITFVDGVLTCLTLLMACVLHRSRPVMVSIN